MVELTCRWCGAPAAQRKVVIPEDRNTRTGELRKAAVEAEVCDRHAAWIDREFRRAELEAAIPRLRGRLARLADHSKRRPDLKREPEGAEAELAALKAA